MGFSGLTAPCDKTGHSTAESQLTPRSDIPDPRDVKPAQSIGRPSDSEDIFEIAWSCVIPWSTGRAPRAADTQQLDKHWPVLASNDGHRGVAARRPSTSRHPVPGHCLEAVPRSWLVDLEMFRAFSLDRYQENTANTFHDVGLIVLRPLPPARIESVPGECLEALSRNFSGFPKISRAFSLDRSRKIARYFWATASRTKIILDCLSGKGRSWNGP